MEWASYGRRVRCIEWAGFGRSFKCIEWAGYGRRVTLCGKGKLWQKGKMY